ncbi:MAG: DUF262 domain-containing protein [Methylotenera sp.]
MLINPNPMNVLDYCNAFADKAIMVDTNYQRTDKVWPEKAKQYLIETIILGYPIPKLFLHQKIDLKSKKSIKYVVDGQQRSRAIVEYFLGKYALSNSTSIPDMAGRYFDSLSEEYQNAFLSYSLPIDLFISASREEIIETFRRINSYTVPLNAEEKRHADYQGIMKWFIYDLARRYSEKLTVIGTLTEKNLSRMADFKFLSEIVLFLEKGEILTTGPRLLDNLYSKYNDEFININFISDKIEDSMSVIFHWDWFVGLNVVKPHILQMIILSIANNTGIRQFLNEDVIREKLSQLSEAIESDNHPHLTQFVSAASRTTNDRLRKTVIYNTVTEAIFA